MKNRACDELVMEIGELILRCEDYQNDLWWGLSVVGDFAYGDTSMTGYIYYYKGGYEAALPESDTMRKIRALRAEMEKLEEKSWHQCLIHITRPHYKMNIQFEYNEPERWSLSNKSLGGIGEFAERLKPGA
ncbi:hypothetical protein [Hahella sp. NBU794]|uniref:hypothetical protein n=1 Tax=Hahella sp. NBU794 TaxID=3422590 RepID=UPI003D6F3689